MVKRSLRQGEPGYTCTVGTIGNAQLSAAPLMLVVLHVRCCHGLLEFRLARTRLDEG